MAAITSRNERLVTLTREMFDCAKLGDWEQLARLEQSRLPLFNEIFGQGIAGNVELAREVLSLDEKTKSLAAAGMPVLQNQILMMRQSGKANMAYQSVHGLSTAEK